MIEIREMTIDDVDAVFEIEKEQFIVPWTKESFIKDVTENFMAIYYVAVCDNIVVGYIGMWHIVTEGHITNVAVLKKYQGQGIGRMLVSKLIDVAHEKYMMGLTLECSTVNEKALNLYKSLGFNIEGERKDYYEVTHEDCYIMWLYF